MAKIFIGTSLISSASDREVEFTGRLSKLILQEFPSGPLTPCWYMTYQDSEHSAPHNIILPDDADLHLSETGLLRIEFGPAGTASAFVNTVILIAAQVAVNAISRALQGKTPAFVGLPEASSVYTTGLPSNEVKVGAPIPVQYGTFMRAPEYAAYPYQYYQDNNEVLVVLLCLGMGEYSDISVRLANTPEDELPTDTVEWQLFGPSDHNNTMGDIESAFGIHENVYTCAEVDALDLIEADAAPSSQDFVGSGSGSNITVSGQTPGDLGIQVGGTYEFEYEAAFETGGGGDEVYVISETDVTVTAISGNTMTLDTSAFNGSDEQGEFTVLFGAQVSQRSAGPFVSSRVGQTTDLFEIDLEFPSGLYQVNAVTGAAETASVTFQATFQEIDANGDDVGAAVIRSFTISGSQTTPLRETQKIGLPRSGRWAVTLARQSQSYSDGASTRAVWRRLKAFLDYTTDPVYSQTSLLALTVYGSQKFSQSSIGAIQVEATRLIEPYEGGAVGNNATVPDVVADIFCNEDYSLGLPRSLIHSTSFAAMKSDDGTTFNGVFDALTTVHEAITSVAAYRHAEPTFIGDQLALAHDTIKPIRAAIFNPTNVVRGSAALTFSIGEVVTTDGYEVSYIDADNDYQAATAVYPLTAENPAQLDAFGCTSSTVAESIAERAWKTERYRTQVLTFETGLEAEALSYGDRIGFVWETLGIGRGAYTAAVATLTYMIFADPPIAPALTSESVKIFIRNDKNALFGPYGATLRSLPAGSGGFSSGPTPAISNLRAPTDGDDIGYPAEALEGLENGGVTVTVVDNEADVRDYIVAEDGVTHVGAGRYQVTAIRYDERLV